MGRFPSEVSLDGDMLKAGQQNVKLIAERVPSELPWGELGVDIVVDLLAFLDKKAVRAAKCRL